MLKITIRHKKEIMVVENRYKYSSYVDVKQFIHSTITLAVKELKQLENDTRI